MRNNELASRLREVFLDGLWIANTNYKNQLEHISWDQATQSIAPLNSIAHLVFHINYYLEGLIDAFNHGRLTIKDAHSFDLPKITKESEWRLLVDSLIRNASAFAEKVEKLEDSDLDRPFLDGTYGTTVRNIEGVIEHSYYHLGQITLIKKLLTKDLNV